MIREIAHFSADQFMTDETPKTPLPAPHFVITHEGDLLGENTPENREIVRRIHACVDACNGITTDELERGIIGDMRTVLEQVVPILEERQMS